jgi:DNA-binding protein H-NS
MREPKMARLSLKKMSVAELIDLREKIQGELSRKIAQERAGLQEQIDALTKLERGSLHKPNGSAAAAKVRRVRNNTNPKAATAKKVQPKYRGPDGETWSGRELAPRWLKTLEAEGKNRESYLVTKQGGR